MADPNAVLNQIREVSEAILGSMKALVYYARIQVTKAMIGTGQGQLMGIGAVATGTNMNRSMNGNNPTKEDLLVMVKGTRQFNELLVQTFVGFVATDGVNAPVIQLRGNARVIVKDKAFYIIVKPNETLYFATPVLDNQWISATGCYLANFGPLNVRLADLRG